MAGYGGFGGLGGPTPAPGWLPPVPEVPEEELARVQALGAAKAQARTDAATAEVERRQRAAQELGVTGSYATDSWATGQNQADPTQSNLERSAERSANFVYGGSETARAEAEARALDTGRRYGDRFGLAATRDTELANRAREREGFFDTGQYTSAAISANMARDASARTTGVGSRFERFADQGPGPSAAQAQLQLGTNAAMDSQLALARSGRGMGGSSSALRQAQVNAAGIQQNAANQAAMLRAGEEQAWRGQQLQALSGAQGAYGSAGGLAVGAGGLSLEAGGYRTNAGMQNRALNDQTALAYGAQSLQALQGGAQTELGFQGEARAVNVADLSARQAYEGNLLDYYSVNKGMEAKNRDAQRQREAAQWGAIGAGAGAFVDFAEAVSDIREKQNITPASATAAFADVDPNMVNVGGQDIAKRDVDYGALDQSAARALAEAPAYSFDYRNPEKFGYEDKRYTGPMAQDLAKTPEGRTAVTRMPDGALGVDTGRLSMLNASAVGEQHRELDRLREEVDALNARLQKREPAVGAKAQEKKEKRPKPAPPKADWQAQVGEAVIEEPGVSGERLGTHFRTPEQRDRALQALWAAGIDTPPGTGFPRSTGGQLKMGKPRRRL